MKGSTTWLPGVWTLRHYERSWLARDVAAGIVLTALLVPAGMGYAEVAGLPAIAGIYATIAPLVAYAIFGPSRILVVGPDSALAALVAAAVVAPSAGDARRAMDLAALLAVLTGVLCVAAAFARAGFATSLLSKPVRVGYMNGIAITVLVSQLPKLFGFSIESTSFWSDALSFGRGVAEGKTNGIALAIGAGSLGLVVITRAIAPRFPGVLAVTVGATLVVALLHLDSRVRVVGALPRGLPTPSIARVSLSELGRLTAAAAGVALVSFADTTVLSRALATRRRERVDPNRELFALGIANVAAGLVHGFPISSSATRTPVAESAGARTQLTGLVAALVMIALLLAAPGLLRDLPATALAAIVIAAISRVLDFGALRTFARVRSSDFALSMIAFFGVAAFGVLPGIAVAVALSLLDFVRRAWRPHHAILGRAPGVKGYHDVARYPTAKQVPGLLLFRWDAPLFFANADHFREEILDAVDASTPALKWVVVAAEPMTDVDTTAAEMLEELDKELAVRGVELAFAEMKDPVKDRLHRYGLQERLGREFFFPTIGVAVKAYLDTSGVDWTDWEESGAAR
jgi:high affinity sulfate transporter 1